MDDGSTKDNTYEKALDWQSRYPHLVKAVHQENGGHGKNRRFSRAIFSYQTINIAFFYIKRNIRQSPKLPITFIDFI